MLHIFLLDSSPLLSRSALYEISGKWMIFVCTRHAFTCCAFALAVPSVWNTLPSGTSHDLLPHLLQTYHLLSKTFLDTLFFYGLLKIDHISYTCCIFLHSPYHHVTLYILYLFMFVIYQNVSSMTAGPLFSVGSHLK